MSKFKRIIIANGGYLKKPVIEVIELTPEDEEVVEALEDDFKDFEEYCQYVIEETCAEFDQRFASTVVLTEEQFEGIKKFEYMK